METTKKEGEAPVRHHAFPCKSCGSRMVFSPEGGTLLCEHCKSTEPIDAPVVEAVEHPFDPATATAEAPEWESECETAHVCPACGAETVTDADDMTLTCPFCGSHYVTELRPEATVLRPEAMVPHKLGREKANALFAAWVKRRYFAPRAFRRGSHKTEMQGVYLPYFTFDTDLSTSFVGQGGRHRTVTYTVRVNGKTETRTRTVTDWYPVAGTRERFFDDTPSCASRHVDTALLNKLGSFSTKMMHVYNPAFLAGFFAERYTVGLGEGFENVRPVVEEAMQDGIESSLGYDVYRGMRYTHTYRRVLFKHILLPVWLSTYNYGGKSYGFMVNGESGKVAGRAPISPLKVALTVLAGIGLIGLFFWLLLLAGGDASLLALPGAELVAEGSEAMAMLPPPAP